MRTAIVLVGSPGAGKGELARRKKEFSIGICPMFGLHHLSSGDALRALRSNPAYESEVAAMDVGARASDDAMIAMVRGILEGLPPDKGVVLDGFPRSRYQAQAQRSILEQLNFDQLMVMELQAPRELCMQRIIGVRAMESGRSDDKDPKTVEKRIKDYESYAPDVLDVLRQSMSYFAIDATVTADEVLEAVSKILRQTLPAEAFVGM